MHLPLLFRHARPDAATLPVAIPFDHATAAGEGWAVAEAEMLADGTPGVQLQHIGAEDNAPAAFRDDFEAWAHVVARARTGSRLHRRALALVDKVERALIEITCGAW